MPKICNFSKRNPYLCPCMKNNDLALMLRSSLNGKVEFSTQELITSLHGFMPGISNSTIAWRLNQLKKEKFIYQVGRGVYSFIYKPNFTIELSLRSKRLYNKIKGVYSGEIVLWDTIILSEILGNKISKNWVFIALNKDDLDFLFNEMLSFSKKVYLLPDKETINRYLIPQDEAIILTPLITETPIERSSEYLIPSIEAILVNAWLEYEQYLQPLGVDIRLLYQQAFFKYNINKSKLLRYARRRDKRNEINEFLKNI